MTVTIPTDPAAWQAYRQGLHGIGASDAGAALGLSPWRSPYDLWRDLTGRGEPLEQNAVMARGVRFEDDAADWYVEKTGAKLARVRHTVRDERWPHLFCHPDRRVVGERKLLQIKTGSRRWASIPPYVEAQVRLELVLSGLDAADVALLTWHDLYIYPLEPDPAIGLSLADRLEAWWATYVETDTPPDEGRTADATILRDAVDVANAEQERLIADLRRARVAKRSIEQTEADLIERVKDSMAGGYGLTGRGWSLTWRPTKAVERTDWKALADGLLRTVPETERQTLIGLHSTVGAPMRPFRLTEEDSDD